MRIIYIMGNICDLLKLTLHHLKDTLRNFLPIKTNAWRFIFN